jgi:protein-tyrosine phosphatase
MPQSVLFVCTANICRSPSAEGVLRKLAQRQGVLESAIDIASAGTHDYHVGKPPYPSALESAKKRGYDLTQIVARQVRSNDFDRFDHILAMDRSNLKHLQRIAPTRAKPKIELLLEYGDRFHGLEVPDPYGGEERDFELALDMIEDGCRGIATLLFR